MQGDEAVNADIEDPSEMYPDDDENLRDHDGCNDCEPDPSDTMPQWALVVTPGSNAQERMRCTYELIYPLYPPPKNQRRRGWSKTEGGSDCLFTAIARWLTDHKQAFLTDPTARNYVGNTTGPALKALFEKKTFMKMVMEMVDADNPAEDIEESTFARRSEEVGIFWPDKWMRFNDLFSRRMQAGQKT